jgi:hypothetical protein
MRQVGLTNHVYYKLGYYLIPSSNSGNVMSVTRETVNNLFHDKGEFDENP